MQFLLPAVDLPSPTGSSNPVARLQAQRLASRRRRPFLTIKDRQKRLGDKFCRRQNFLVSQLAACGHLRPCKLPWRQVGFLGVDLPSLTGSSNPVARLQAQRLASRRRRPFLTIKDRQKRLGDKFCRWQNFLACGLSQRSDSPLTLSTSCGGEAQPRRRKDNSPAARTRRPARFHRRYPRALSSMLIFNSYMRGLIST